MTIPVYSPGGAISSIGLIIRNCANGQGLTADHANDPLRGFGAGRVIRRHVILQHIIVIRT